MRSWNCPAHIGKKAVSDSAYHRNIRRDNLRNGGFVFRPKDPLHARQDVSAGGEVANAFTGLWLGANYAWARGVTALMNNQLLDKLQAHGN